MRGDQMNDHVDEIPEHAGLESFHDESSRHFA